jgi:hypothetical protein
LGYFFPRINFAKNELGYILGDFFSQKLIWSPWSHAPTRFQYWPGMARALFAYEMTVPAICGDIGVCAPVSPKHWFQSKSSKRMQPVF